MCRRLLMSFAFKTGLRADSKGRVSALSGAGCTEKQALSEPRKEPEFTLLATSTCNASRKLPALQTACLHPPLCLFFFYFPLPSPPFWNLELLAGQHRAGKLLEVPGTEGTASTAWGRCSSSRGARLVPQLGRGSKSKRRKRAGKWVAAARGPRPGIAAAHSCAYAWCARGFEIKEPQ